MANSTNMLQLCRLCLVKDDVNIPIFEEQGDIRQIFLKISSCLPVKVSREDRLPKKICDGCSYKLDMLYEFWNTSANAEKQLLSWLGEAGVSSKMADGAISAMAQQMKPTEAFVKEETLEPADLHAAADEDEKEYLFEQQKVEESASAGPSATVTSNEEDEPPPKRARRTAAVKAAIAMDQDSDDDDDSGEPLTKVEDESEDSDGEDHVPAFVDVPSTSADDQPGPSGVGKDGVEAPYFPAFEVELQVSDNEYDLGNAYQNARKIKAEKQTPIKRKIKLEPEDDEYTPPGFKKKASPKDKKPTKPRKQKLKIRKQEHKVWTCRRCLEEFDSRRDLTDHTKVFHPDDPKDTPSFKYDTEQDIYTCSTCSAEYQTKEEVEAHITKVHEEFYTCEVCRHTSKKAYSFAVHMKSHSTDDTYTCPLCNYNTPRRTCLQTHINRVHYHKFYYTCPTCGKGFNDSVIFKEHNNEHLGIKPFVCVVCNKDFVYSRYMMIHQTRYHTVHIEGTLHKTQCSICLKVFSKVPTLLKHITTKHNADSADKTEKRHLCDICGKGFGTSDKLKIHYRIHTGDKPFSCSYCDKRFTKKDYLIMHTRVHTGEKPYPCEYCGKCFNQAASLRIHVRGHTGERPYMCQFCNGGYISRGSLNLHMKICNGVSI